MKLRQSIVVTLGNVMYAQQQNQHRVSVTGIQL